MRKFRLGDFAKSLIAFSFITASGIDAFLYAMDKAGWLRVHGDWYLIGPMLTWGCVAIPLSISLGTRLVNMGTPNPPNIKMAEVAQGGYGSGVKWTRGGVTTTLASQVKSIWGTQTPDPVETRVRWLVPLADRGWVVIRQGELEEFLKGAEARHRYKFSRRYWTQRRPNPYPVKKYLGMMALLEKGGLIEGRGYGASGWLVRGVKPRQAVNHLRYGWPRRLMV